VLFDERKLVPVEFDAGMKGAHHGNDTRRDRAGRRGGFARSGRRPALGEARVGLERCRSLKEKGPSLCVDRRDRHDRAPSLMRVSLRSGDVFTLIDARAPGLNMLVGYLDARDLPGALGGPERRRRY
jgi:hypothetical protein